MTAGPDSVPPGIDTGKANIARVYDYWPGGTSNFLADQDAARALLALEPNRAAIRTRDEILRFFGGFEIIDPGLVYLPLWRPDSAAGIPEDPRNFWGLAGVGRLGGKI